MLGGRPVPNGIFQPAVVAHSAEKVMLGILSGQWGIEM